MSEIQAVEVKTYNQYFASRNTINITMGSGKRIKFVGGTYITDKKDEIAFLDGEIAAGNSMIYNKKNALTVTSDQLDPLASIRKKAVEDYLAQQAIASSGTKNMGNTAVDKLAGLKTTQGIGAVAVQVSSSSPIKK